MRECVIGVDIGGTNIRVGMVDEDLKITRKETALTDSFASADELFGAIRHMIELVDEDRRANKIGMALPVPWRDNTEKIVDVTNIPCLENIPVQTVQAHFPGYEVYFDNDVNVIALLESEQGASKGYNHSMYITVSTGIGSGIIVHNEILHGAHGYAGEIGNMFVSDSGVLEDLCSGKALEEESKKLYGQAAETHTLFERYHQQDPIALDVIGLWVERFSRALATVMQTIDPDIFVLGGAVIDKNPWLIEQVLANAKTKVLNHLGNQIRIVSPSFGSDAGLIGAGYLAWKLSRKPVAHKQD